MIRQEGTSLASKDTQLRFLLFVITLDRGIVCKFRFTPECIRRKYQTVANSIQGPSVDTLYMF